ncbi:MAG: GntR family transcriptional regulator [Tetrasphaera sp.]
MPEEVAAYVRELIISGKAKPGEFLRMEPIAEAVGVSITPVREGLLALSGEGFVELVPRRGFVVTNFTPEDVRDIFWAQAQFAGELAARAAKRSTPADLDRLREIQRELDAAIEAGDEARVAELGHVFHRQVNRLAASPRLARLLKLVVSQLPNTFYAAIEGHLETTSHDHEELLRHLQRSNGTKARAVMSAHIMHGADRLVEMLNSRGLWSATEDARAG